MIFTHIGMVEAGQTAGVAPLDPLGL